MAVLGGSGVGIMDLNDALISNGIPPRDPVAGALWIDTSTGASVLKVYINNKWETQKLDVSKLDPDLATKLQGVIDTLGTIANDGVLTFSDRVTLAKELGEILGTLPSKSTGNVYPSALPDYTVLDASGSGTFANMRLRAIDVGIGTDTAWYKDVETAYKALNSFLSTFTPKPWDITTANKAINVVIATPDVFRQRFLDYYMAELRLATETEKQAKIKAEEYAEKLTNGSSVVDKTEILSGNPIFTDKSDDAVIHVGVDGKSEQNAGSGKNLVNMSGIVVGNLSGANGVEITNSTMGRTQFLPVSQGQYSYSLTNAVFTVEKVVLYDSNKNFLSSTDQNRRSGTIIASSNGYARFCFKDNVANDFNGLVNAKFQFEAGNVITPYEPPAPSPDYPIAINSLDKSFDIVSSVGKENLILNSEIPPFNPVNYSGGAYVATNVAENVPSLNVSMVKEVSRPTGGGDFRPPDVPIVDGKNKEYTVSVWVRPVSSSVTLTLMLGINDREMTGRTIVLADTSTWVRVSYSKKFSQNIDGNLLRVYLQLGENQKARFSKVKLEEGLIATSYSKSPKDVQYDTQSPTLYKTNILLSEPLRSVRDVKDRLFLDTDGLWKVERNVEESNLKDTGISTTTPFGEGNSYHFGGSVAFIIALSGNEKTKLITKSVKKILSSHFTYTPNNNYNNKGASDVYELNSITRLNGEAYNRLFIRVTESLIGAKEGDSVDSLVSKFSTWVNANNPNIVYELATPTIETLSAEQQTKLNNIQSFKGSNYVYTLGNVEPNLNAQFKSSGWADKWRTEKELKDVTDSLSNLEDVTLPALSDGLLNKAEKESIKQSLNLIETDKKGLDAQYNSVYSNVSLTGVAKTNLSSAKTAYNTAQSELKVAINAVLNVADDVRISPTLIATVTTEFSEYGTALAVLKTRFEEAMDAISGKKVGDVNTELGKVTQRVTVAEQKVTDSAIVSTVTASTQYKNDLTGKVSTTEVISRINQSAETVQIEAKNVNFKGAVTFESFDTTTKTAIDAKSTKTEAQGYATTAQNTAKSYTDTTALGLTGKITQAQTDATNAKTSAGTANQLLTDLSSDSILTPVEKKSIKKEWDIIVSEKAKIDGEATKFGVVTEKATYNTQYSSLNTYIAPLITNLNANSTIVAGTFRANFKNYYDARQDVLNAITSKAKTLADSANAGVSTINSKINSAVTTIDKTGVTVKDGSFFLEDNGTDTKYSVVAKVNLIKDHSFEAITNFNDNVYNADMLSYKVSDQDLISQDSSWRAVGSPYIHNGYGRQYVSNLKEILLSQFGQQSATVNDTNYVIQPDILIRRGYTYTLSAFFKNHLDYASWGTPEFKVELLTAKGETTPIGTKTFPTLGDANYERSSRYSYTFTVPGTSYETPVYLKVAIKGANGYWVNVDGIQLVQSSYPVVYTPEETANRIITSPTYQSRRLPINTNLNNLFEEGNFFAQRDADAITMAGSPTILAFSLNIERHAGWKQTITNYQTHLTHLKTWVRNYYFSTGWGDWKVIVGSPEWIGLSKKNGWGNYGGAFATPSYMKDANNVVHLRGMTDGGTKTSGVVLATLPLGYRPEQVEIFTGSAYGGTGHVQIYVNSSGDVSVSNVPAGWISLSGISFLGI